MINAAFRVAFVLDFTHQPSNHMLLLLNLYLLLTSVLSEQMSGPAKQRGKLKLWLLSILTKHTSLVVWSLLTGPNTFMSSHRDHTAKMKYASTAASWPQTHVEKGPEVGDSHKNWWEIYQTLRKNCGSTHSNDDDIQYFLHINELAKDFWALWNVCCRFCPPSFCFQTQEPKKTRKSKRRKPQAPAAPVSFRPGGSKMGRNFPHFKGYKNSKKYVKSNICFFQIKG